MYEIQLVAFNGNGDSIGNKRLVSLAESGTGEKNSAGELHYIHYRLSFLIFIYLHEGIYPYTIHM